MKKITIMRHGERLDSVYPIYWLGCIGQYWADSPLTANGHKTAEEKGKNMIIDDYNPLYIYTSPYQRTMQTSIEIQKSFPKSQIIIEPLFSEYQPFIKHCIQLFPQGIPTLFEGETTEYTYPESYEKMTSRVKYIFSQLVKKNNDDIIIVTHGEVVKVFLDFIREKFDNIPSKNITYLTSLFFIYDTNNNCIVGDSINIK